MILILTSSGWRANKKVKIMFSGMLRKIQKNVSEVRALLISISDAKEKKNLLSYHIHELRKLGIRKENIEFLTNVEVPKSNDFDVIYVCGGNTYLYMHRLRKTKWDRKIKNLSKKKKLIYFGISAGSIIAGKWINIASLGKNPDKNIVGLRNMRGLGLVPYCILPHYSTEDEKEIREYERKIKCKVIRIREKRSSNLQNLGSLYHKKD